MGILLCLVFLRSRSVSRQGARVTLLKAASSSIRTTPAGASVAEDSGAGLVSKADMGQATLNSILPQHDGFL
jgi:hypothetical protein